jgi:phage/plasmid primase-like uncharacterized protein
MYDRDLNEPQNDRIEQAARALLAAAYDPITFQANWPDLDQLGPMARERLMEIVRAAVEAVPGGTDEAAALAFLRAVAVNRPSVSN